MVRSRDVSITVAPAVDDGSALRSSRVRSNDIHLKFGGYVQLVPLKVQVPLSSVLASGNHKRFERVSIPCRIANVTLDVTLLAVRICEYSS
jgi:hypothetical protein